MSTPPSKYLLIIALCGFCILANAQYVEKPLFSFTGYYESVMGTVSYVQSQVSWSYLYEKETEDIKGLRLFIPHEGYSTDFLITEFWGNDEAVMFICEETAILMRKQFSTDEVGPIISISKESELDMPRHERSYCRYFAREDFEEVIGTLPAERPISPE